MQKIELQSHIKGNAEEFAVKTQIFEQEIGWLIFLLDSMNGMCSK